MITIRDVARLAGVSVATVSRVLNNSALVSPETRETVMQAVTQLGYRPNANAQALATQVSDTIGVVVMDVSDPFFGALVKAVDVVAQQHGKMQVTAQQLHHRRLPALHVRTAGTHPAFGRLNALIGQRPLPPFATFVVIINVVTGGEIADALMSAALQHPRRHHRAGDVRCVVILWRRGKMWPRSLVYKRG